MSVSADTVAPTETLGPVMDLNTVVAAMQTTYRTFQKASIYPQDHPAVPKAFEKAIEQWSEVLAGQSSLPVHVSKDHLVARGETLDEASGALESFALLLHDLDVAAVEFFPGLSATELEQFVRILVRARKDAAKGPLLVTMCEEKELSHVLVVPLDYSVLSFSDGAREEEEPGERAEVWDNLTSILTDPSLLTAAGCPEDLAKQVCRAIQCQEGAGVGELRQRISKVSRRIDRFSPEERDALRDRLADFVSALNPDLRSDLLRVDPRRGDDLAVMADLADVVPEPDLLDALQEIDRAGGRVPAQMLTLMNKMVRIATDSPSFASGLEDVLDSWGIDVARNDDESPDLRSALQEVFRSRVEHQYNPEPYQTFLDDLARSELGGTEIPLDSRYRDPGDAADLELHAAELAVQVLGKPGGEKQRAKLFGYLATITGRLVQQGRFDLICDAAMLARTYAELKNQSDDVHAAARGYLAGFHDEDRAREILKQACSEEALPEASLSLLGLGGEKVLDQVVDALDGKLPLNVATSLREFVLDRSSDEIAALLDRRYSSGWPRLRSLVPVLRELEPERAVPLARRLLEHPESRVRREALNLVCEIEARPGAVEDHLCRALGDGDKSLVAFAVFRLANRKTPRSLRLLGDYLRGCIPGIEPSPGMAVRASRALSEAGSHGARELCEVLHDLRWKVNSRSITIGFAVAEVLGAHSHVPPVRKMLRRWGSSPACLIGRLFPRLRNNQGAR